MNALYFLQMIMCVVASSSLSSSGSDLSTSSTVILSGTSLPAVSSSSIVSCSPTTIPQRAYKFQGDHRVGWRYFSGAIGDVPQASPIKNIGINQCKALCAAEPNCRTFFYVNYTSEAVCGIDSAPYSKQYWLYDNALTDPLYTAVYSVESFRPPKDLLVIGDFERGCFDPWTARASLGMRTELTRCVKRVSGDCFQANYYAHLFGTPKVRGGDSVLMNESVVSEFRFYKLSCRIKGIAGLLQLSYDTVTGPLLEASSTTTSWLKVDLNFPGKYGGRVSFTAFSVPSSPVDWKLDACTVKQIS